MQIRLFRDSPLAIKLLLVPVVATFSFAAYLVYSTYVISDSNSVLAEFRDIDYPILDAIERNHSSHEKIVDALHTAAATGENEFIGIARASASEMLKRYETLERLDSAHVQTVRLLKSEFISYLNQAIDVAQRMANRREMPDEQRISSMRAARDSYLANAANYQDVAEKDFHDDIDKEIAGANRARQWGGAIGIFMLVAIALLTIMVTRGILSLERVVSDRNRTLLKVNADLEQEIAKLKEAEEAKSQAESANRIKDQFLANMSHELRTPMHAVLGLSHLCLQTHMSPKQRDYLKKIHTASSSLLEILNDILDISKIESGNMELDKIPFNLEEVTGNLVAVVRSKAQEKGVSFSLKIAADVPLMLTGDPLRLGQILINLTSNAVKFTERGQVSVLVDLERETSGDVFVRFAVTDTGIGMTQVEIERLFRPFTQADTSITRRFGGTGLGLSISKRLVELMGGIIKVDSIPGVGSKFFFTARFAKEDGSSARDEVGGLVGMRVLIASAEEETRRYLNAYVNSYAFDVTCCKTANEALDILSRANEDLRPYKLVICDARLFEQAGVDAASWSGDIPATGTRPKLLLYSGEIEGAGAPDPSSKLPSGFASMAKDRAGFERQIAVLSADANSGTGKWRAMGAHDPEHLEKIAASRILLVEDNEINRQVARELLEGFGATVVTAEDGQRAIEVLAEDRFDCVLMDLQMPVMDGITATREIRRKFAHANIPIIALTANVMVSEQKEILGAGMNDHVGKPINLDQLVATLGRWLPTTSTGAKSGDGAAREKRSQKPLPVLPGINVAESVERIGGKVDVYYMVLVQFSRSGAEILSGIREALTAGELDVAARHAHTLRGILATIGADTVSELAGALENRAKAGSLDGIQAMFEQLESDLDDLVTKINSVLG
jgi:signal transduction histidine kinase/CheY-like chemotaxis protein/HPt (histidine-containing phosphotransfer) domain-containing protein